MLCTRVQQFVWRVSEAAPSLCTLPRRPCAALSLCIALCIIAFALLSPLLAGKMLRLLGFADRTPIRNSAEAVQRHRLPKEMPGLPSQTRAVDKDHPAGTPGWHVDGSKTVLQQVRSALHEKLEVQPFAFVVRVNARSSTSIFSIPITMASSRHGTHSPASGASATGV